MRTSILTLATIASLTLSSGVFSGEGESAPPSNTSIGAEAAGKEFLIQGGEVGVGTLPAEGAESVINSTVVEQPALPPPPPPPPAPFNSVCQPGVCG